MFKAFAAAPRKINGVVKIEVTLIDGIEQVKKDFELVIPYDFDYFNEKVERFKQQIQSLYDKAGTFTPGEITFTLSEIEEDIDKSNWIAAFKKYEIKKEELKNAEITKVTQADVDTVFAELKSLPYKPEFGNFFL